MKTRTFYQLAVAIVATIALSLGGGEVFGQTAEVGSCTNDPTASSTCTFSAGEGSDASANGAVAVSGGSASGVSSFAASEGEASGENATAVSSADASGTDAFAASKADASGSTAIALGNRAFASGDNSIAIGRDVQAASTANHNFIIGKGIGSFMTNNITNSIMLGMNSDVPTVFIEGAGGTADDIGRVGIGTTDPDALVHLLEEDDGSNTTLIIEAVGTDDNSQLHFDQNGGNIAKIRTTDNGNFVIENNDNNGHMIFEVNDGGVNTEAMRIEGTSAFVGIGTNNPDQLLHVENGQVWIEETDDAPAVITMVGDATGTDEIASIRFETAGDDFELTTRADGQIFFGVSSGATVTSPFVIDGLAPDESMWITTTGVGIGTSSPAGELDVDGKVFIDYGSLEGGDFSTDTRLGINSTTGRLMDLGTSTINMKEEIENLSFDKEAFLNLRPVDFRWKPFQGANLDVGLIAEEVHETFPALTMYSHKFTYLGDGDVLRDELTGKPIVDTTELQIRGVRYHKLPVYLLALAQDQQHEIDSLKSAIFQLMNQVDQCCSSASFRYGHSGTDTQLNVTDEYLLLRNDPNPFSDYTNINYETSDCSNCHLIITDANGHVVKKIQIREPKGTIRVYSSEIGSGLFMYSLVRDGEILNTNKMISSKL